MLTGSKYFTYCALSLFIFNQQHVFAWQPIADVQLSSLTGEESPISIEAKNLQQNTSLNDEIKSSSKEEAQPLSIMEQYVQESLLENLTEPLLIAINIKQLTSEQKNEFAIKTLHKTAENHFGLEPFSYIWHGNYQDILNVEDFNSVTFNVNSGQYEMNNVRGQVFISAYSHTNDNRTVLLTKTPIPLE